MPIKNYTSVSYTTRYVRFKFMLLMFTEYFTDFNDQHCALQGGSRFV